MKTVFPKDIQQAWGMQGAFRAGATDVWERSRKGLTEDVHIDLQGVQEMFETSLVFLDEGLVVIPAMMTISELALVAPEIGHYALTQVASSLATPAIRNVACVGGNLLQEVRCPYYRSGQISCLKTGGEGCPAREGDHRYLSTVDLGGCIAPHPSTLALAFVAIGALVRCLEEGEEKEIPIEELWINPKRRLLLSVVLPVASETMSSAWYRISNRQYAEWPLVEVVLFVRESVNGIEEAYAYAGGVASIPLLIPELTHEWKEKKLSEIRIDLEKPLLATHTFLPQSQYKERLLNVAFQEALQQIQEQG